MSLSVLLFSGLRLALGAKKQKRTHLNKNMFFKGCLRISLCGLILYGTYSRGGGERFSFPPRILSPPPRERYGRLCVASPSGKILGGAARAGTFNDSIHSFKTWQHYLCQTSIDVIVNIEKNTVQHITITQYVCLLARPARCRLTSVAK